MTLSPQTDDQSLIAAANRGEAQAFETLYLRYRDRVLALAWRFTRDEHLSAEVTQETFLFLLRKFPGFELRCELFTFLYPVVKHTAVAAMQRDRREAIGIDESVLGKSSDSDRAGSSSSTQEFSDLAAAMASLPEGQAEVVRLRFVHDLPLSEIAQALGVPLGTVKSRLHLALGALQANPRVKKLFEP